MDVAYAERPTRVDMKPTVSDSQIHILSKLLHSLAPFGQV